ncbi:hypothetical protein K491DRAFT_684445 [Lophiostoma macrostomum CBS 122681]|uniref:Uncharacterized protein n=1 Tax=Lophiostoma macrostomum CBS 122681 TaxID=1314788 RepID=A0A6A6SLM5_9PLEO|nr:hypothetical protein K491DRAFT_684445 [Lophiostoma macrostomum CBS 122681]
MNSSTRLYERLGQIPQDPQDPDSLDDLIVCAFGAFERYYVCWKTRAGEIKQDGYDLPADLREWLFPTDGTERDFPTLQVVFGRGNEYFASDKNGKLEFKEPEIKKPMVQPEPPPKDDRPAPLKRSRTISFLRPLSDSSPKPTSPAIESPSRTSSRSRSSSISQPTPRPLITSFPRPALEHMDDPHSPSAETPSSLTSSRRSSYISQSTSRSKSTSISSISSDVAPRSYSPDAESPCKETIVEPPVPNRLIRRSTRPLSMSFNTTPFPKIVEGRTLSPANKGQTSPETHCACCRHNATPRPMYANASVQTDPEPLQTNNSRDEFNHATYSSWGVEAPLEDEPLAPNPVVMGRMFDFFSKPGYQLGDSLASAYSYYPEHQENVVYEEYYEGPAA